MTAGSGIELDAVSPSSPRSPKEQEVDLGRFSSQFCCSWVCGRF